MGGRLSLEGDFSSLGKAGVRVQNAGARVQEDDVVTGGSGLFTGTNGGGWLYLCVVLSCCYVI